MPNSTVICYLSSLLSYGMGFFKISVLKHAVTEHANTYDYNINVSLATGYFVLAIFFTTIGFLFFYIKNNREQDTTEINDMEFIVNGCRELDDRGRASQLCGRSF